MTGVFLNGAGILLGGFFALARKQNLSADRQKFFKIVLGAFTVFFGLRLTWTSISGPFGSIVRQILILLIALTIGRLAGRLLRLQKASNAAGRAARERLSKTPANRTEAWNDGFWVSSLLFCVSPLAFLGAIQEGLTGYWATLALKGVLDALAVMAFVSIFGWGSLVSAIPVVALEGLIFLAARAAEPWLRLHALVDSINATGGILVFCCALIILELKRVELTDYLPSLVAAPLLTWFWH
jgi:uncharacterized membrane protein YqgA involved in biofilm formation